MCIQPSPSGRGQSNKIYHEPLIPLTQQPSIVLYRSNILMPIKYVLIAIFLSKRNRKEMLKVHKKLLERNCSFTKNSQLSELF